MTELKEIELHLDPTKVGQVQTELLIIILANQMAFQKFLFETTARSNDELIGFHQSQKKECDQTVQRLVDEIYSRYGKIDITPPAKQVEPPFLILAFSYLIVIIATVFHKIKRFFTYKHKTNI